MAINDIYVANTARRLDELSRGRLSVDDHGMLVLGQSTLDSARRQHLLHLASVAKHAALETHSSSLLTGHLSESDDFADLAFSIKIDRDEDIAHRSPNDIARLILNQLHLSYTLIVEDDAIAQRLPKHSSHLLSQDQKDSLIHASSFVGRPTLDFSASITPSEDIHVWAIRIAERQYLGLLTISVHT
ncbi:hypothetical protein E3P77_03418 [Wallemia ichthyophaga]|nr:hypothetical protein E3P77_03418 [Wallemia ichthyophaga]